MAGDEYLPHIFRLRGDRLAFTTGILVLATLAIVLVWVFKAETNALISLYAVGSFVSFTLLAVRYGSALVEAQGRGLASRDRFPISKPGKSGGGPHFCFFFFFKNPPPAFF